MRTRRRLAFTAVLAGALVLPDAALAHGIHGEAETIPEFVRLGIRHMLGGWDHLLFIAGVVFVAGRVLTAAKLVSLFVLGHSSTLLLATLLGWRLSAEAVDVVIALSLAYVGWRIVAGRPERWAGTQLAVVGFGLVHGLGLSSRLQEQPLPEGGRLVADILAFNVGVEIGQLSALALLVGAGVLVRRLAPGLIPSSRYVGLGLVAVGLVAAAALSFGAARPEAEAGPAAAGGAAAAACSERPQLPRFEGKAALGGHPQAFHDLDDPASPNDLQHVVGDGYVVVQYSRSLGEDDRSELERWANGVQGVVVTPMPGSADVAVSAQTSRTNFSCARLDVGALGDFHSRWFRGQAG